MIPILALILPALTTLHKATGGGGGTPSFSFPLLYMGY
jgi:hypothetical protein